MDATQTNQNCIVCASEFVPDEMNSVAASKINITRFKICQSCLDMCDPEDDYRDAQKIVNAYLNVTSVKYCYSEVKEIIDSVKESK